MLALCVDYPATHQMTIFQRLARLLNSMHIVFYEIILYTDDIKRLDHSGRHQGKTRSLGRYTGRMQLVYPIGIKI
jgi:hypothetical protein